MVRFKGMPPYLTFVEYGEAALYSQLSPDERERYEQVERDLRVRLDPVSYERLQCDMDAQRVEIQRRIDEAMFQPRPEGTDGP